jgi:hypothetical protein
LFHLTEEGGILKVVIAVYPLQGLLADASTTLLLNLRWKQDRFRTQYHGIYRVEHVLLFTYGLLKNIGENLN